MFGDRDHNGAEMTDSNKTNKNEFPSGHTSPASLDMNDPDEPIIEPDNPLPSVSMQNLPEMLRKSAQREGWKKLTPVQSKAIPYFLADRDMMVQSRTGTGKTAAFLLPILHKIDPDRAVCQALVLVPTRELAQQVSRDAASLSRDTNIRFVAVYGGVGYGAQLEAFRKGAHLVIGTPGRILDHLIRGSMNLDHLRVLVFDEADRLLSMGFYPDMKDIDSYLPRRRTGFMFSATFPTAVQRLARQFLNKADFLSLSRDIIHISATDHIFYEVPAMDKDRCLVRIIEVENPESAIIFCNTKMRVNYVATVLQRFGYDADQLTANLSQNARDRVLTRLRDHSLQFLVATNLAARGIDITKLSHVISYEVPEEAEAYIHRTGRTGRAGAGGVAISLVAPSEKPALARLARQYNILLEERQIPSKEDVANIVSQRLTALLEAKLRKRDRLKVERMQRLTPLTQSLGESEDGLALMAMVLDDFYQESHHTPQSMPFEEKKKKSGDFRRRRRPDQSRRPDKK